MSEQPTLPGLNIELEPGEPIFVLRARDPLAPHMVALWAALRIGDTASAVSIFSDTVSDPGYYYRNTPKGHNEEKISSASAKAKEMNAWRKENYLEAFGLHTVN